MTTAARPRPLERPLDALPARRPRTQRATPAMILDTARRIARSEGWPAVTIRRVADTLGYTSPLLYEHFRDKEAMLTAVLHEGFGALAASMAASAARPVDPADPDAYAMGVADAYLSFARRDPAVYRLMNGMGGVPLDPAATLRGAMLTCEVGVGAVQTWAAATGVRVADPLAATEVLWCTLHGVTCLAVAGRLDMHSAEAGPAGDARPDPHTDVHTDALLQHAIRTLLVGWRAMFGGAG